MLKNRSYVRKWSDEANGQWKATDFFPKICAVGANTRENLRRSDQNLRRKRIKNWVCVCVHGHISVISRSIFNFFLNERSQIFRKPFFYFSKKKFFSNFFRHGSQMKALWFLTPNMQEFFVANQYWPSYDWKCDFSIAVSAKFATS